MTGEARLRDVVTSEELEVMKAVLWGRRVRLGRPLGEVELADQRDIERIADAITAELMEKGRNSDDEPSDYGKKLDSILGRLFAR